MKILIVRAYPSFVNLKENTYNQQEIGLAKAFLEIGHDAGIVYYGGKLHSNQKYKTAYGTIDIYYRKARVLLKRISLFEDFSSLKERYDLIISNEYDQIETIRTIKQCADKTVIYHGPYYSPVTKRYNAANKIFDILFAGYIRKMSPIIVTKSKLAQIFLENKKFSVAASVGVGLDLDQMLVENECCNPLEAYMNHQNIYLLYIGKLEQRRNIFFLLEILEKLIKLNPYYRLVMVGKGDKEYADSVFSAIKEKKLEQYIIYEPSLPQNQLPFLYRNCDFFLLPTAYEIWGMVLMEAMRFNLPVITTYNGGSSSLICSGTNGCILDLDSDLWVNAIQKGFTDKNGLMICNEKILSEMCSWKSIAYKILEVYFFKKK